MSLGLKALDPRFLQDEKETAEYFELDYKHFLNTADSLGIEYGDLRVQCEEAARSLKENENLYGEEEKIAALLYLGDKWWLRGNLRWTKTTTRIIFEIPERLFRLKSEITVPAGIEPERYPCPGYSSPTDFDQDNSLLRKKVQGSTILHLDWFQYLLSKLEIDNEINFQKAKKETISSFTQNKEISEDTALLQKSLSENDIDWVNQLERKFNFNPFFLKNSQKNLEKFLQDISNNPDK